MVKYGHLTLTYVFPEPLNLQTQNNKTPPLGLRNGVLISIPWHPRAYGCMDLLISQTVIIEELIEKIRPFIIIAEKYKSKHCYVFCREILIDLSRPLSRGGGIARARRDRRDNFSGLIF